MQTISIRKATKSDWEQIFKLSTRVWRSAYSHIMPQEIFTHREETLYDTLEKRKNIEPNTNDHFAFVAEDKNKIVAFALAQTISNYAHYKELAHSDLYAIYVDKNYQHKGLGKRLFDLIVAKLKKTGSKKMVIGVLKDNLQARRAYEKWGGELDDYESYYKKLNHKFKEVFYLYDLDTTLPLEIQLKKATITDYKTIHKMQVECFKPLLEKYKDYTTNPALETLEKVKARFEFNKVDHFLICLQDTQNAKNIGYIRIQHLDTNTIRLSQIVILPDCQNKGYAQNAIKQIEKLHPNATKWILDTIKQEKNLCHLYEKLGYTPTGEEKNIKPNMDLVYYSKLT